MLQILNEIGVWITANGEGIYGSRPWKIFGEKSEEAKAVKLGRFNENYKFNAKDIRFTTKGSTLYAFCLGKPEADIIVKSLAKGSKLTEKAIASVGMVGSAEKISWKQTAEGLVIKKPVKMPEWQVIGFKIEFKK
jgi:alpha-L-fucosidase